MNSDISKKSKKRKKVKPSSIQVDHQEVFLNKVLKRKIIYRQELFDHDCVHKSRLIRKRFPKLRTYILRMFKFDLSTVDNFQDNEDLLLPKKHEVSIKWLPYMKHLMNVEFYLTNTDFLDLNIKTLLMEGIQNLKRLVSLTLYIGGPEINDRFLNALAYSLRSLPNLRSFAIDATETEISDEGVCTLALKSLHKLKKLKKLDLGLGGNPLTDKSVFVLVKHALIYMTELEDLQICLWHSELTNEGLDELSKKALSKLPNLKKLQLFFAGTHIDDGGVESLIDNALVNMRELRFLELGLNYANITNKSIINLSKKALKKMYKMKTLCLNFSSNDIQGQAISALAEHAFNKMKQLQELKLSLGDITIRDKDFLHLATVGLVRLPNLKVLVLDFMEDSILSDSVLQNLAEHVLIKLTKLELFRFFVNNNRMITDTGLTFIAQTAFCKMNTLKKLVLGLGSTKVSNTGVQVFAKEGLSQMENLEECDLELWATKITNGAIESICKDGLPGMKSLKKLKLLINETKVNDDGIYMLLEALEKIKGFSLLILDITFTEVTITENQLSGLQEKYGFKIKYCRVDEGADD